MYSLPLFTRSSTAATRPSNSMSAAIETFCTDLSLPFLLLKITRYVESGQFSGDHFLWGWGGEEQHLTDYS